MELETHETESKERTEHFFSVIQRADVPRLHHALQALGNRHPAGPIAVGFPPGTSSDQVIIIPRHELTEVMIAVTKLPPAQW